MPDQTTTAMHATLHATPDNPIPDNHVVGHFNSPDGLKLRYALFRSGPDIPVRGTVVLVHGRTEYIEKYFEIIRDLTAAGLWVATYDLRGQGGSGRMLADVTHGHVRRFSDYERDLDAFFDQVVLPDARLPFFLIAHSTGGLIAMSAAPMLANRIERLVIAAPFLGLSGQIVSQRTVTFLSRLFCLVGLGERPLTRDAGNRSFESNVLTSDPVRYQRTLDVMASHDHLSLGPPTTRWLDEAFRTMAKVSRPEFLASIPIPTIMLVPVMDSIIPYAAQERVSKYFRAARMIPIAGARHDLFQERDIFRAQAMAAILAFIPGSDKDDSPLSTAADTTDLNDNA